jgi:hypothetical protein
MPTTTAQPTYNQIIASVRANVNEEEKLVGLQPQTMQMWILEACQQVCEKVSIFETRTLRLIKGIEDTPFQDTTGTITATGNVTISGTTLTGVAASGTGTVTGTAGSQTLTGSAGTFLTQLKPGNLIIIGTESIEILSIESSTSLTLASAFVTVPTASAYTYSTTRFLYDLVTGSVITVNSQVVTIASISAQNAALLVTAPSANQTNQTFTVDTYVQELPTRMINIISNDRIENNIHRQIEIRGIGYYDNLKTNDLYNNYTNYDTPHVCAVTRNSAGKYVLKFYPVPDAHKEVIFRSRSRTVPRFHITDALTANVPLDEQYEPSIRLYVEAMVWGWLKDRQYKAALMAEFEKSLIDLQANTFLKPSYIFSYE